MIPAGRGSVREVPYRYGQEGCGARRKCVREKSERGEGREEGKGKEKQAAPYYVHHKKAWWGIIIIVRCVLAGRCGGMGCPIQSNPTQPACLPYLQCR